MDGDAVPAESRHGVPSRTSITTSLPGTSSPAGRMSG
jgi:hypothetical protein